MCSTLTLRSPKSTALGVLALTACLLGAGLWAGCSKDDDQPKVRTVPGRVAAVDPASGEVQMYYYNEKEKKEILVSGTLASNAEILINGRTARLEDVRVDDKMTVTGRIEKHDGERNLIAVKVEIDRPGEADSQPESQPTTASQPAAG